jgi:hypothetical protein
LRRLAAAANVSYLVVDICIFLSSSLVDYHALTQSYNVELARLRQLLEAALETRREQRGENAQ